MHPDAHTMSGGEGTGEGGLLLSLQEHRESQATLKKNFSLCPTPDAIRMAIS